jgi:phosphoglycolate phosphatase-like HAD superfamily hydrolase
VLVRLARQRAESAYGTAIPPRRVAVIGDTPFDVYGAHDAGALAIAVATGYSDTDELTHAGADSVLPDLTDTAALQAAIHDALHRAQHGAQP